MLEVELERAVAGQEGHLAVLLPDLAGAGPTPGDEYGRARLFDLTARLLERLAAQRTLMVAIEDLHWSDRSTRELLAYLVRTVRRCRVVLVVTFRADDLHRRHPLRACLAELERLSAVQRLQLERFAREEVALHPAGLLNTPEPDRALVARIYERSDGNAFFVEELARTYQDAGEVRLRDSLRDILLVRMEALSEPARRVVAVAAGGGSSVEHALPAAVVELPEDDLVAALRAAVGAHVLVVEADSDSYRFRHALMREAVLEDLLPTERSRINSRYALALENAPHLVRADQRAGRLASYWYHAHDPARALPAALAAGRQARRGNAFVEQLLLLQRALELWEQVPRDVLQGLCGYDCADEAYPGRPPTVGGGADTARLRFVDVPADATIAASRSGDQELSVRFARTGLQHIDQDTEPEHAAWFCLQRSRAAHCQGHTGKQEAEQARRLVENGPPSAVQADVLHRLSTCGALTEPTREHLTIGQRAVRIAREVGARAVELHTLNTVGVLHVRVGEIEEGLTLLREVCVQSRGIDDPYLQTRAYVNLSAQYGQLGRSEEAVETAREGLAIARRYGLNPTYTAMMLNNLADSLLALGRLQEAEDALASMLEGAASTTWSNNLLLLRAELALLGGDLSGAAEYLTRISNDRVRDRQPQQTLPRADLAVRVAVRSGRFAEARAELLAAIGHGLPSGFDDFAWSLLVHGASAEADSRGLPDAETGRAEVLERIRQVAQGLSRIVPLYEGWALMLDAELARAEGRNTPEVWMRAVEVLRPTGRPHPLAEALFRAAAAHVAAGSVEVAGALLREAEEQARKRGDTELLHEVTALAQRSRMPLDPTPPTERPAAPAQTPDPSTALGLTARERDVLQLLTLGRTNGEIAQALHISPKTAGVHVSNILTKLNVGNRGEAAAAAHRMRLFLHAGKP
ncbi:LuxR C-terminal-related transcriptional regulator [Streptomyces sp. MK7]|uniref:helix-turn-helix transcriptional regulator n=1 Tax=Streptomyces sp. MK7 TaxID=3067635 RepID=UPI002930DBF5|nr:LuxR C-terminal-related transcriptional regulator [Streptomyces sp. MK7]